MQALNTHKICSFYGVGELTAVVKLQNPGYLHQVWRLETTKNYFLLKRYALHEKNQLRNSTLLSKKFLENNIPLVLPIYNKSENFYEDLDGLWILYPWVEGRVLSLSEVRLSNIKQIAELLSNIHHIDYSSSQAHLVLSHGDLYPPNVIWQTDGKPIIVDWDQSGMRNQCIDLFNTASNWAGIETGNVDLDLYGYFLDSYYQQTPCEIDIDESVIAVSKASWENWLAFNRQSSEPAAIEQCEVAKRALSYLTQHQSKLFYQRDLGTVRNN